MHCVPVLPILAAALLPLAGAAQPPPGSVLAAMKISETAGGFTGDLDDIDQFGKSVAALGDLDGDGVPDVAVGAYRDDDGGMDAGAVWILFLQPDGTVKAHQKISPGSGGFSGPLTPEDWFGVAAAGAGDVDGDGVVDLVVGAAGDGDGGARQGAAWVLFLKADGTVKGAQKISATSGGFTGDLDVNDLFGAAVAGLGDVDGDGTPDVAVGALRDDDGGTDRGAVWILFLTAAGTVKSSVKLSATAGGFGGALADGDGFGAAVTVLGDQDGDGIVDLAIGATRDDDGGTDQGAVWVTFLQAGGTVKQVRKISALTGGFGGDLDPDDWFGNALAPLGDLDADGVVDLAVGAPFDDDGGSDNGAVWTLFLAADGSVREARKISATAGGFPGPLAAATFGWALAGAGDLDGDGAHELVVGSNRDNDGGFQHGAAWTLFLADARWLDAGGAVAGAAGVPSLVGAGPLLAGQPVAVTLAGLPPQATALLVLGLAELGAPFAGGVFVPRPDVIAAVSVGPSGTLTLGGTWPPGLPAGLALWLQAWRPDAAAPQGYAASNGLVATPP